MRVCSICGERNEDWMDICQRCGNSIANADKVEYKATRREPVPVVTNTNNTNNMNYNQSFKEKKPIENMDLKIILVVLLIILICLIAYSVYVAF